MWYVTKIDVDQTVSNVCWKVLNDHSVSDEVLLKRREALEQVAERHYDSLIRCSTHFRYELSSIWKISSFFVFDRAISIYAACLPLHIQLGVAYTQRGREAESALEDLVTRMAAHLGVNEQSGGAEEGQDNFGYYQAESMA